MIPRFSTILVLALKGNFWGSTATPSKDVFSLSLFKGVRLVCSAMELIIVSLPLMEKASASTMVLSLTEFATILLVVFLPKGEAVGRYSAWFAIFPRTSTSPQPLRDSASVSITTSCLDRSALRSAEMVLFSSN